MWALKMKTKLITPYCFLSVVKNLFPEKDITLPELTSIIDFFNLQPEIRDVDA